MSNLLANTGHRNFEMDVYNERTVKMFEKLKQNFISADWVNNPRDVSKRPEEIVFLIHGDGKSFHFIGDGGPPIVGSEKNKSLVIRFLYSGLENDIEVNRGGSGVTPTVRMKFMLKGITLKGVFHDTINPLFNSDTISTVPSVQDLTSTDLKNLFMLFGLYLGWNELDSCTEGVRELGEQFYKVMKGEDFNYHLYWIPSRPWSEVKTRRLKLNDPEEVSFYFDGGPFSGFFTHQAMLSTTHMKDEMINSCCKGFFVRDGFDIDSQVSADLDKFINRPFSLEKPHDAEQSYIETVSLVGIERRFPPIDTNIGYTGSKDFDYLMNFRSSMHNNKTSRVLNGSRNLEIYSPFKRNVRLEYSSSTGSVLVYFPVTSDVEEELVFYIGGHEFKIRQGEIFHIPVTAYSQLIDTKLAEQWSPKNTTVFSDSGSVLKHGRDYRYLLDYLWASEESSNSNYYHYSDIPKLKDDNFKFPSLSENPERPSVNGFSFLYEQEMGFGPSGWVNLMKKDNLIVRGYQHYSPQRFFMNHRERILNNVMSLNDKYTHVYYLFTGQWYTFIEGDMKLFETLKNAGDIERLLAKRQRILPTYFHQTGFFNQKGEDIYGLSRRYVGYGNLWETNRRTYFEKGGGAARDIEIPLVTVSVKLLPNRYALVTDADKTNFLFKSYLKAGKFSDGAFTGGNIVPGSLTLNYPTVLNFDGLDMRKYLYIEDEDWGFDLRTVDKERTNFNGYPLSAQPWANTERAKIDYRKFKGKYGFTFDTYLHYQTKIWKSTFSFGNIDPYMTLDFIHMKASMTVSLDNVRLPMNTQRFMKYFPYQSFNVLESRDDRSSLTKALSTSFGDWGTSILMESGKRVEGTSSTLNYLTFPTGFHYYANNLEINPHTTIVVGFKYVEVRNKKVINEYRGMRGNFNANDAYYMGRERYPDWWEGLYRMTTLSDGNKKTENSRQVYRYSSNLPYAITTYHPEAEYLTVRSHGGNIPTPYKRITESCWVPFPLNGCQVVMLDPPSNTKPFRFCLYSYTTTRVLDVMMVFYDRQQYTEPLEEGEKKRAKVRHLKLNRETRFSWIEIDPVNDTARYFVHPLDASASKEIPFKDLPSENYEMLEEDIRLMFRTNFGNANFRTTMKSDLRQPDRDYYRNNDLYYFKYDKLNAISYQDRTDSPTPTPQFNMQPEREERCWFRFRDNVQDLSLGDGDLYYPMIFSSEAFPLTSALSKNDFRIPIAYLFNTFVFFEDFFIEKGVTLEVDIDDQAIPADITEATGISFKVIGAAGYFNVSYKGVMSTNMTWLRIPVGSKIYASRSIYDIDKQLSSFEGVKRERSADEFARNVKTGSSIEVNKFLDMRTMFLSNRTNNFVLKKAGKILFQSPYTVGSHVLTTEKLSQSLRSTSTFAGPILNMNDPATFANGKTVKLAMGRDHEKLRSVFRYENGIPVGFINDPISRIEVPLSVNRLGKARMQVGGMGYANLRWGADTGNEDLVIVAQPAIISEYATEKIVIKGDWNKIKNSVGVRSDGVSNGTLATMTSGNRYYYAKNINPEEMHGDSLFTVLATGSDLHVTIDVDNLVLDMDPCFNMRDNNFVNLIKVIPSGTDSRSPRVFVEFVKPITWRIRSKYLSTVTVFSSFQFNLVGLLNSFAGSRENSTCVEVVFKEKVTLDIDLRNPATGSSRAFGFDYLSSYGDSLWVGGVWIKSLEWKNAGQQISHNKYRDGYITYVPEIRVK